VVAAHDGDRAARRLRRDAEPVVLTLDDEGREHDGVELGEPARGRLAALSRRGEEREGEAQDRVGPDPGRSAARDTSAAVSQSPISA